MFPKSIISEVPVLRHYKEVNGVKFEKMNIKKAISKIERLLEEANKNADSSACGYDDGWYNGEGNAYETVLEILKKI